MFLWSNTIGLLNQDVEQKLEFLTAAAAKSLQSCPTLCNPIDVSPPGSPAPGILQARTLEWGAIAFSNAWKWKESEVAQSCPTQQPYGPQPTRLLSPWDFPGKSTGVGCHCLLRGFLTAAPYNMLICTICFKERKVTWRIFQNYQ